MESKANTDAVVTSLLVACVEWLKAHSVRLKYCYEEVPGRAWYKRVFGRPAGYAAHEVYVICDSAIAAVNAGDLPACQRAMSSLQALLQQPMVSMQNFGGREYSAYLAKFIRVVDTHMHPDTMRKQLISLWFDMTHGWRSKHAKGVPTVPDLSQFMLIEWLATLFLMWIGIGLPTIKPETVGAYKFVPAVYFAIMCLLNALGGLSKRWDLRQLYFWVGNGIGIIPVYLLQDHMSRWVLWSWSGGAIVGVLIGNHLAYRRSRRMANKYGPFACLWSRHLKKNTYEFILVKTDGTVAWHYRARGWYQRMDPLFGSNLSLTYRGALRRLGYEAQPLGGWLPCYPALVATRMIGMRRRNPVDWDEARRSTPGLTDELIDEFFAHTPSPLGPTASQLAQPIAELTSKQAIPW